MGLRDVSALGSCPLCISQASCGNVTIRMPIGRGAVRARLLAGVFATGEETPYPLGLCQAAARDISLVLRGRGVCVDERQSTDTAAAATNAQKQPRRGRGTVGPSEYKLTVLVRSPASYVMPDPVPENPPDYLAGLPVGSKLLLDSRCA